MGDNLYKDLLKAKKLRPDRLIPYGFIKAGNIYEYRTSVMNGEFDLTVQIEDFGDIDTTLIESENGEEYVLYKTGASGTFVGSVRLAIEETLNKIIASCYGLWQGRKYGTVQCNADKYAERAEGNGG